MESIPLENEKFKQKILYITYNQDFSCLCLGTQEGYIIYNISPFKQIYKRSNKININFKKYRTRRRNRNNKNVI